MSWFRKLRQSFTPRFGRIFIVPSSVRMLLILLLAWVGRFWLSILLLAGVGRFVGGLRVPVPGSVYNDSISVTLLEPGIRYIIHGSTGALLMIGSGIAAILMAILRRYREAFCLLVLAVAVFWLRSMVNTLTVCRSSGASSAPQTQYLERRKSQLTDGGLSEEQAKKILGID